MAETTWLLKTSDALYGPETQERLVSWAKAGKIQPGQSISPDGEEWTPVTEVPFLDMRWSIDLQDGKPPRGPFHRDAVNALLSRGRLPENVRVIEVREPWLSEELELEEAKEDFTADKDNISQIPEEAKIEETVEEEIKRIENETPVVSETDSHTTEQDVSHQSSEQETIEQPDEKQPELPNIPPDASVLYRMMREEAENLAKMIEAENRETEEFRIASLARRDRMQERRQAILRLIGSDTDDMLNRAKTTYPSATRDANLRQDYNALRLLQERVTKEAKSKIDFLTERLNKSETEVLRLRKQNVDATTISNQLIETREALQRREKEIVAMRQRFEEERQRYAFERQSLMTRLSSLESGIYGNTNQTREAQGVKLAPWMSFKK